MIFEENVQAKLIATTLMVGLLASGASLATPQDVRTNENGTEAAMQAPTQSVTAQEARLASANGIVLHFGDDISESMEKVIQGGLRLAGYEAEVFRGGPTSHITLCINERCGERNFSVDAAHRFLLTVLNNVAPEYRSE
ncbi:hypothetical protein ELY33_05025 [Vreelandella andesensis]|uniref:Uncharacterized protein n=1 Tax=Vreelandella andesensis TaxID=447567 RepID=A0A3S0WM23_9GAMM|nr:hypothetical protein [Halomonas andesensis]RUR32744.1 hypothetical protein ELY33_05025 [Halomonas andesensis]